MFVVCGCNGSNCENIPFCKALFASCSAEFFDCFCSSLSFSPFIQRRLSVFLCFVSCAVTLGYLSFLLLCSYNIQFFLAILFFQFFLYMILSLLTLEASSF